MIIYFPNCQDIVKRDETSENHYKVAEAIDNMVRRALHSYYYVMNGERGLLIYPRHMRDPINIKGLHIELEKRIKRQNSRIIAGLFLDYDKDELFIELMW